MNKLFLCCALLVIGFLNAQVKIGNNPTTMNTASLLELESTTQGFLPPRMTNVQKTAIVATPSGLQVWCTDCGANGEMQVYNGVAWVNFSGAAAVPGAPISPVATAGVAQASIAFTAPASEGGSAITGYTVTSVPSSFTNTGSSSPLTVTGLANGTSYTFTVVATNVLGNSVASAAVTPVTPATFSDAPTSPVATAGIAQASIAFTAPAYNGGGAITGYTVTASPSGFTATGASSPLIVTGLTNGTSYTFTVVATNVVGNSVASTASVAVTPVPPATVPDAPISPVAIAGVKQASVAFTAPASNGGSAITGYTVTSSPGSVTKTGTSSPLLVTGLTNGTSYTFTVIATNAVGNSVPSSVTAAVKPNCGAFVASGVFKVFACYNLGATNTTLDPNVPVQAIHGNYYQWGRSDFVATASTSSGAISGWNNTAAVNSAWIDGLKNSNDPCPLGFRVPKKTEWDGVFVYNAMSVTGSWTNDSTNFSTAISWGPNTSTKTLTLPAAGNRYYTDGTLNNHGYRGNYWTSTADNTNSWGLNLSNSSYTTNSFPFRTFGFSVRCISQ